MVDRYAVRINREVSFRRSPDSLAYAMPTKIGTADSVTTAQVGRDFGRFKNFFVSFTANGGTGGSLHVTRAEH